VHRIEQAKRSSIRNSVRRAARTTIENLEGRRLLAGATPELVAVVDGTQNFGNTRRAVAFYDVTDVRTTPTGVFGQNPLFSIFTGYEITDVPGTTSGDRNFEETQAFTVSNDGGTGYFLATDSGTPGGTDALSGDSLGDYDLYRLNIRAAYSDFVTNNRPRGVMYMPTLSPDFIAGGGNISGIDYAATYGGRPLGPTGLPNVTEADAGVPPLRSNANGIGSDDVVFLSNVTAKVGELARRAGGTGAFFDQQDIQYVDDDTLLVMENTSNTAGAASTGPLTQDYSIRTFERVSTLPGQAVTGPDETGGYNGANTKESWQAFAWTGDNYVDMDQNATTQAISDVDGMRYVNRDGVQGAWVSDRDGGGDDFAFFDLDFDTRVADKLEQRTAAAPYPTAFALDEDPTVDANTNDGDLDGFDLDSLGNLVIRESGFTSDTLDVDQEPKIITRVIANYNAGDFDTNLTNEVTFGAWDTKANLVPTVDDDTGVTNGLFAVYDKAQNLLYYFDTDSGAAPALVADVYVYDLTTETLIYQELDAANNFFSDGNRIKAFTLSAIDTVAPTVALSYTKLTEQAVTLQFSEDVAASFAAGDLVLTNTTTATVIPTADLTLTPLGGNAYKLTYKTGAATAPLPRGKYTLAITGAVADAAGNALAGTPSITFNVQPGDANNDNVTDFADLVILAQNYNTTGHDLTGANFNYDGAGLVDFADLVILAQNYNLSLPAITIVGGKLIIGQPVPTGPAATVKPVVAKPTLATVDPTKTSKGGRIASQVL
jgi:hypothetical protein